MTTVSFTDLRSKLSYFLDKAEQDCEQIVVTRGKGRKSVLLALDDFLSLQETAYLLSSPKNRVHLAKSMQELSKGKTVSVAL